MTPKTNRTPRPGNFPPASKKAYIRDQLDAVFKEFRELRTLLESDPRCRVSPYTVQELARLARRHPDFISRKCRSRQIRTLAGKPYRIAPGEVAKFLGLID
jgi:hypothetical protein